MHMVFACFDIPGGDHLDQLGAVPFGDVVVLGKILGHMVELPAFGIQLGQSFGRDGIAKAGARFREGRSGPGADRPPAVVVNGTVPQHFKVLGVMLALRLGIVEACAQS